MELHFGMLLEPVVVLLVGIEIIQDDMKLAAGKSGNDAVHEAKELDAAAAFRVRRDDFSGGDFDRGKQRSRAVPRVVMALAGQSPSVRQLQIALRPLQCLDRRLLINAQDNGFLGRGNVKAHNIGGFGRKRRIVALAPGFAGSQINLVLAQEPSTSPNALASSGSGPARKPRRRRLVQKHQYAFVRPLPVDRRLARPRKVLKSFQTVIGKAAPPIADNARLDPNFLGNRTRAAALSRQQHYPCPFHIALRRRRCPAARLKHLAYLRLEPKFSRFGNHPDLESRLTYEEKWVLAWPRFSDFLLFRTPVPGEEYLKTPRRFLVHFR